jgi:hypothetical protein
MQDFGNFTDGRIQRMRIRGGISAGVLVGIRSRPETKWGNYFLNPNYFGKLARKQLLHD